MSATVRIIFTQGSKIEVEVNDLTEIPMKHCGNFTASGEIDENNAFIDLDDNQAQALATALYVAGYNA